jgi:hypothetical protein
MILESAFIEGNKSSAIHVVRAPPAFESVRVMKSVHARDLFTRAEKSQAMDTHRTAALRAKCIGIKPHNAIGRVSVDNADGILQRARTLKRVQSASQLAD